MLSTDTAPSLQHYQRSSRCLAIMQLASITIIDNETFEVFSEILYCNIFSHKPTPGLYNVKIQDENFLF